MIPDFSVNPSFIIISPSFGPFYSISSSVASTVASLHLRSSDLSSDPPGPSSDSLSESDSPERNQDQKSPLQLKKPIYKELVLSSASSSSASSSISSQPLSKSSSATSQSSAAGSSLTPQSRSHFARKQSQHSFPQSNFREDPFYAFYLPSFQETFPPQSPRGCRSCKPIDLRPIQIDPSRQARLQFHFQLQLHRQTQLRRQLERQADIQNQASLDSQNQAASQPIVIPEAIQNTGVPPSNMTQVMTAHIAPPPTDQVSPNSPHRHYHHRLHDSLSSSSLSVTPLTSQSEASGSRIHSATSTFNEHSQRHTLSSSRPSLTRSLHGPKSEHHASHSQEQRQRERHLSLSSVDLSPTSPNTPHISPRQTSVSITDQSTDSSSSSMKRPLPSSTTSPPPPAKRPNLSQSSTFALGVSSSSSFPIILPPPPPLHKSIFPSSTPSTLASTTATTTSRPIPAQINTLPISTYRSRTSLSLLTPVSLTSSPQSTSPTSHPHQLSVSHPSDPLLYSRRPSRLSLSRPNPYYPQRMNSGSGSSLSPYAYPPPPASLYYPYGQYQYQYPYQHPYHHSPYHQHRLRRRQTLNTTDISRPMASSRLSSSSLVTPSTPSSSLLEARRMSNPVHSTHFNYSLQRLRDRLRLWGPQYLNARYSADVFIKAVPLRFAKRTTSLPFTTPNFTSTRDDSSHSTVTSTSVTFLVTGVDFVEDTQNANNSISNDGNDVYKNSGDGDGIHDLLNTESDIHWTVRIHTSQDGQRKDYLLQRKFNLAVLRSTIPDLNPPSSSWTASSPAAMTPVSTLASRRVSSLAGATPVTAPQQTTSETVNATARQSNLPAQPLLGFERRKSTSARLGPHGEEEIYSMQPLTTDHGRSSVTSENSSTSRQPVSLSTVVNTTTSNTQNINSVTDSNTKDFAGSTPFKDSLSPKSTHSQPEPSSTQTVQASVFTHPEVPFHLEFARAHVPALASLLLSGHIREKDTIDLPLPHPQDWLDTVRNIYTGSPLMNQHIKENIWFLGGKA